MDQVYILWGQESTLDLAKIKAWSKMTNFIRYKDELINLDLVAIINKSFYDNKYNITFFGDSDDNEITCLRFDNEEIRDKIFDDICHNIQFNYRSTFIEIKNEQ